METVFARLAPLEARLAELEGSLGRMDPREALDRFAERLEETRTTLQSRIEDLASEENPFAAISEQLTRLYAQKDATVETVFARLAPLEARLAELEGSLGRMDPREALDRFAERLEETRTTLQSRIEDLASEENPFAAISEQLTRLYAQKDATVETVFARLAPLEARLAELEGSLGRMDPREALDRFAERLEETRTTLQSRIEDLASEENPFAAISEQLTRLYAQKDATVETVFARLAPLEARLAELEGSLGRHGAPGSAAAPRRTRRRRSTGSRRRLRGWRRSKLELRRSRSNLTRTPRRLAPRPRRSPPRSWRRTPPPSRPRSSPTGWRSWRRACRVLRRGARPRRRRRPSPERSRRRPRTHSRRSGPCRASSRCTASRAPVASARERPARRAGAALQLPGSGRAPGCGLTPRQPLPA